MTPHVRLAASLHERLQHGIRRTVGTLAKLAVIGGGPRFRVANRTPLYETDELDDDQ